MTQQLQCPIIAVAVRGDRGRYAPTFGPLMNSALNAADRLIVPVESGYFALMRIKELLTEIERKELCESGQS